MEWGSWSILALGNVTEYDSDITNAAVKYGLGTVKANASYKH